MNRWNRTFSFIWLLAALAGSAPAQGPPQGGPGSFGRRGGPPPERGPEGPRGGVPGKWWTSPTVIRSLGLTTEQQRGLEDIFQQTRPQLIDLSAALQKEEAILEPLLGAEHPQETRVLAQIDRVADARAALEKADARMLFRFRTLLSGDQWTQLQNMQPGPQPGGPGGRHGPPGGGRN